MTDHRNPPAWAGPESPTRRRFVQGAVAGGTLAGLGLLGRVAAAGVDARAFPRLPELRGSEFDLVVGETPVDFTGRTRSAITVNGSVPAPLLRWREGDTVTLRVTNRLRTSTSIHWHGILLPFRMDGVPGLTYPGIGPGETFVYRFRVAQSGTYWYHSHSGFQEQQGHYGPIVIEPRAGERHRVDRDYVVMLSDWTDENPQFVYSRLKEMDGYYNYSKLTIPDLIRRAEDEGIRTALGFRLMWDRMRMSPRDLSDVTGATYTYLMNGLPPAANWSGLFRRGEKVRLRFINGSAMSFFDVRIPGLKMTVVAADGQDVEPVSVDEFRIGVAETFDVIVQPHDDRAYTVFAQSIDRSGYARGTLAPRAGMEAPVPPPDPVPTLGMADMGMPMSGHGGHGGHAMPAMTAAGTPAAGPMGHAGGGAAHAGHAAGGSGGGLLRVTRHPPAEYGAGTAMRARVVSTRLDDPGVGLRNNGRRVLTYADLHTLGGWLDAREPARTVELHLTGNMDRYMWSFDGVKFSRAEPIELPYGERVRFLLINDTMMEHPIHLHGLWSEVESPDGDLQVRKHTVNVKPGHAVSYRVLADAVGRWAYHCHLLYHMKAGMFREVRVL